MYDWALILMNLNQEGIVYFKNKNSIDGIGYRLLNTRLLLE